MTKIISLKLYLLLFFTICSTITFSQTVINYQTWTSSSGCNIFGALTNVPATVNGTNGNIAHLTAIGQPTYDNVNKSVNLVSQIVSGSQNQGTEYRTTLNFKASHSYKITINAARIMSQQTGANVLLRLDLNNGGSGGNTLCNGTGLIDASGSGNLKQSLQIISTSFSDYVFNYNSLSAAQTYLMVGSFPPTGSVYQTILIRKITIEETPPPVTFTLSPLTSSIVCGSTTAQTFTVTNVHNTPNVTSHLWNLGASNGWLYNGNPAPQTISTGTSNILTLNPDCGATQKNISVTISAGGNNYNTNTSTVSVTPPSMTITGNATLCSGSETYTLNNVPCNASVTWSATPAGAVNVTPYGNTVTVTQLGRGDVTLTALINACNDAIVSKTISVGPPPVFNNILCVGYCPSGFSGNYCTNTNYVFFASPSENSVFWASQSLTYYWSYSDVWTNQTTNVGTYYGSFVNIQPTLNFPQAGDYNIQVVAQNQCGTSSVAQYRVTVVDYCSGWGFTASPNPANSIVEVALDEQTIKNEIKMDIKEIQITDKRGNTIKQFKYGPNNKRAIINISSFKADMYFIRVFNGKEWKTESIFKK